MVRNFSTPMQQHLNQALSKLCSCILLTRADGNLYGFTTHDRSLTIGEVVYQAGFKRTDLASNLNLDLDNVSTEGILSLTGITADEVRAGRWDYCAFRIFQVNWSDLTMGDKKDMSGHVGQLTMKRQTFIAELLGLVEAYTMGIGKITQPGCRANLGDQQCKVDLVGGSPSLTVTGTITTDYGDFFTIGDSSRTEADTYFSEGVIEFTSGEALGLRYELKSYVQSGGIMITKTPIGYNVAGSTYSMHAGCDKQRTTCRDRFSNVANFDGEPWLRGNDSMVQVGRHS